MNENEMMEVEVQEAETTEVVTSEPESKGKKIGIGKLIAGGAIIGGIAYTVGKKLVKKHNVKRKQKLMDELEEEGYIITPPPVEVEVCDPIVDESEETTEKE